MFRQLPPMSLLYVCIPVGMFITDEGCSLLMSTEPTLIDNSAFLSNLRNGCLRIIPTNVHSSNDPSASTEYQAPSCNLTAYVMTSGAPCLEVKVNRMTSLLIMDIVNDDEVDGLDNCRHESKKK